MHKFIKTFWVTCKKNYTISELTIITWLNENSVIIIPCIPEEDRRVKRRTSTSSDGGFKGFDLVECNNLTGYCQVLGKRMGLLHCLTIVQPLV